MHESEVQTLVSFSSSSIEIVGFPLGRQLLPLPFLALVAPHIVLLCGNMQYIVEHRDGDQGAVSFLCGKCVSANVPFSRKLWMRRPTINRDIILLRDIITDDTLHLHKYIVKSSRHGPGPSAVADAIAPADLDRSGVGYDNSVVNIAYVVYGFEVEIWSKSGAIRQVRNQFWEKMPM